MFRRRENNWSAVDRQSWYIADKSIPPPWDNEMKAKLEIKENKIFKRLTNSLISEGYLSQL